MSSVIPVVVEQIGDRAGREEGIWRIAPQGRLDARTVSALESALESALSQGPRLVVDLSGVPYISSGGLRALMTARRRARAQGGDLRLCGL
ncbi:MAG: anti-sigma factor antagonist, partial [Chloroflexi bacterium]